MIKFDEDVHCRGCAGRGESPEGYDCSVCGGSGLLEIQVGYGPRSMSHVILPGVLPARPGRPYEAPVRTACNRKLSGLMNSSWVQPAQAERSVDCATCLKHVREILKK